MRKNKVIKIDDREITVKELTVRQIWGFFNQPESGDGAADHDEDVAGPVGDMGKLLALACPDLPLDAALDMAPSELDSIWRAFQEVNSVFLDLASKMGLTEMIQSALRNAVMTSTQAFAA